MPESGRKKRLEGSILRSMPEGVIEQSDCIDPGLQARRRGFTEKKMFGGIAFLLRGNMCCGTGT